MKWMQTEKKTCIRDGNGCWLMEMNCQILAVWSSFLVFKEWNGRFFIEATAKVLVWNSLKVLEIKRTV